MIDWMGVSGRTMNDGSEGLNRWSVLNTHAVLVELLHRQFAALWIRSLQGKVGPDNALARDLTGVHLHQLVLFASKYVHAPILRRRTLARTLPQNIHGI